MALLMPFQSLQAEKEKLWCWRKGILEVGEDDGESNMYNFSTKRRIFYEWEHKLYTTPLIFFPTELYNYLKMFYFN